MKLIFNPAELTAEFKRLMRQYKYFDWAVAWASIGFDGFERLKKHRGKIRHVVVGTEFHQTHPDFIEEFRDDAGVRFRMDQEGMNGIFHPKVFLFSNTDKDWEVVVGSSNFTQAAFKRNVECAVCFGAVEELADLSYAQLFEQIRTLWNAAKPISRENLLAYRTRWELNRARLAAAAGYKRPERVAGLYDNSLLNLDWPDFYRRAQSAPGSYFQERLRLLDCTREIFDRRGSLHTMSLEERKCICGTAIEDGVKWRLFGSMAGNPVFKKRIGDNDQILSDALDLIPATGPVTRDHYEKYVSAIRRTFIYDNGFQGVAIATRLLCIKRPDYFVCIDGKNKDGLARALGLRKSGIKLDCYWEAVIEPILESPWYRSAAPNNFPEKAAWNARVAMIDALFYRHTVSKPDEDAENSDTDWEGRLDVVNCGKTMDEIEAGAYMCPNKGKSYNHLRAQYMGSYRSKAVRSIHEIDALVACTPEAKEFKLLWKNIDAADGVLITRAREMVKKRNPELHDRVLKDRGLQVFLFRDSAVTNFVKDSPRGLFGSHIYFHGIAKSTGAKTALELAKYLNGRRWSEFGH